MPANPQKPQADWILEDIGELVPLAADLPRWDPGNGEPWPPRFHGAALAAYAGRVVWAGSQSDLETQVDILPGAERISAGGRLVTPGFVDSHTHLVFAGSRADEFLRRLQGVSYKEIARQGGGIARTMRETRAATAEELFEGALKRLFHMVEQGTTTVEIKSGYGLDVESELKMLEVTERLKSEGPVGVVPTFLGAHFVPPGGEANSYLDSVIQEMLPEVSERGLARFCDVFCEEGVFDVPQSRRVLQAGMDFGLRPKLHAEQLEPFGGAALAAELRATSADHLEHALEEDLVSLAECGTVGVLLPGASMFLGTENYAPVERMRRADLEIALATDCNPGTCRTESMPQILFLAVVKLRLTPGEALRAACLGGARALGMEEHVGSLEAGKQADCVVFDVSNLEELIYHFGVNHVSRVVRGGKTLLTRPSTGCWFDETRAAD